MRTFLWNICLCLRTICGFIPAIRFVTNLSYFLKGGTLRGELALSPARTTRFEHSTNFAGMKDRRLKLRLGKIWSRLPRLIEISIVLRCPRCTVLLFCHEGSIFCSRNLWLWLVDLQWFNCGCSVERWRFCLLRCRPLRLPCILAPRRPTFAMSFNKNNYGLGYYSISRC